MIKEIIFYGLYATFMIIQIITSSYIIHNKNNINYINYNTKECMGNSDKLNTTINISLGILISDCSIIILFIMCYFSNKLINKTDENLSLLHNTELFREFKLNIYQKFNLIFNSFFVISVITFIILNGIQFIYQLMIDNTCISDIDRCINGFYIIYKLMLSIAFFSSYALFIMIPIVIH
jgi:hypothetical protein